MSSVAQRSDIYLSARCISIERELLARRSHLIRRRQVHAAVQREQEDALDQQRGEHEGGRQTHQSEGGAGQRILAERRRGRQSCQEEEAEEQRLAQEQVSSVRRRRPGLEGDRQHVVDESNQLH